MKIKIIYGIVLFIASSLFIVLFLGVIFYLMEVEDHYEELSEVFQSSRSGDILVLNDFEKIGRIDKDWTRMSLSSKYGLSIGFYNWANQTEAEKIHIRRFRSRGNYRLIDLEQAKIQSNLESGELRLMESYRFTN
ncbi:MAG: hypothetical protein AAGD28_27690 [Bacteroidota bacterium]